MCRQGEARWPLLIHQISPKAERPGTSGIEQLIAGIAMGHADDEGRLARGSAVLDDLYEYLRRKGE